MSAEAIIVGYHVLPIVQILYDGKLTPPVEGLNTVFVPAENWPTMIIGHEDELRGLVLARWRESHPETPNRAARRAKTNGKVRAQNAG